MPGEKLDYAPPEANTTTHSGYGWLSLVIGATQFTAILILDVAPSSRSAPSPGVLLIATGFIVALVGLSFGVAGCYTKHRGMIVAMLGIMINAAIGWLAAFILWDEFTR